MSPEARMRFHRTLNAIIEDPETRDGATRIDWVVLHVIEARAGYKTWRCRLSQDAIAAAAGCSRRHAKRSVSWWRARGWLRVVRNGRTNVYEIGDFRPAPGKGDTLRPISEGRWKEQNWGRLMSHQMGQTMSHQMGHAVSPDDGTTGVPNHRGEAERTCIPPQRSSFRGPFPDPPISPPQGDRPLRSEHDPKSHAEDAESRNRRIQAKAAEHIKQILNGGQRRPFITVRPR